MAIKVRISDDYLRAVISLLIKLGVTNVSRAVAIEAWKTAGYECDDIFFMHLDALEEYRFLKYASKESSVLRFDQLLSFEADTDELLSVTHEGLEFLNCFGGR